MATYAVRVIQARCAALGFWPGPIDGVAGPRTSAAESAARAFQKERGKPFIHGSGISRVHWHWTGGRHQPNETDKRHYHRLITGKADVLKLHSFTTHLAHTLNANGGAVAVSMCGMIGAQEIPFKPGPEPITTMQISQLARETAQLCKEFDIPVSPWSTLSHAEVQPSLGIKQNQKWDANWIPGMERTGDPITVGNRIRELVRGELLNL